MVRKVVWIRRANNRFDKIIDYLNQEWGANVTRNFVQKTFDILELISDQPELGTLEDREKQIRGFLLTKQNRLFYRVTENEIVVLNLFDTRSKQKRF
jgi:plasmid stabilization system protein ParE